VISEVLNAMFLISSFTVNGFDLAKSQTIYQRAAESDAATETWTISWSATCTADKAIQDTYQDIRDKLPLLIASHHFKVFTKLRRS
jgi:hypothetical protein